MINASRFIEYGGILPLTLYNPLNRTIRQGSYTGVNNEFIWSYISGTVSDNNICSFDISAESWEGIFTLQIDKDTFIDLIQKNGIFFKFNLFELEYTNLTNIKFSVEHSYNKSSDDTVYYHQTSIDLWKEGEENKIACAYLPPSAFNGFFKEEDYVSTESIRIYVRAFGPNFTLSGKFNKPMLLIPNINLEYCFPYFASLSLEDKAKIIEKTVPYFYGYKTLGDTINLATPQFFSVTNLTELGDYSYRREEDQVGVNWSRIGWGGISGYNYARLNVSTNTSGLTFCFDDDKYIHFKIGQLGQMECMRFGMSSVSSATYLNEYGNYLYCAGDTSNKQNKNAPAGEFSIDYDSYMRVDISDSGWDFLFKISGFSDEDIYDWCRSFPSKENFPFTPHFNALELGKVGAKKTENDTVYTLGIAKLKLKNLVPSNAIYAHNTRKGPNTTIDYIDTLQYNVLNFYENGYRGRKIYIRCTYWANRNKEEGEVIGTFSFSPGNLIPVFDAPEISTTKNTVSKVYTIPIEPQTVTNRIGYYIGSTTYTTTSILKDIETYRDQTMIIDVNELERAFPYFATLSDLEKKEVLDTLPFFEDELVLGDTLKNETLNITWARNGYNTEEYEETENEHVFHLNQSIDNTRGRIFRLIKNADPLNDSDVFYSRMTGKVSQQTTYYASGTMFGCSNYFDLLTGTINAFDLYDLNTEYKTRSLLGKCNMEIEQASPLSLAYIWNPSPNSVPNLTLTIRKELLLFVLNTSGWYTFFKLKGATNQAIYDWCETIPYFEDTYDVPISLLTITATAGEYSDSVILSKVQDGADGEKGNDGTPGQDGADAQLLLLSSDVPAFRFKADGTPYPDQIATVKVTKQGISQTTEFVASNGMAISDNVSEIKVTPYMLGAKFRMKNLVPSNAIYAHNTRKGPNTTVTYIDTLQYDVLNFYENGYRGRKIYIRCTYWANRNKEEGEVIGTFSFSPGNLIPVFDAPEISTTKNTVSKVYTIPIEPQTVTNRIGYYIGSTTYTTTSILKDIETYRDQTMIIDVNELEEAFPYFASLSDNEKKEILDTLPFFEDEFVLCGELRNLTPNPPYEWTDINGNLITITNQGESTLVSSTGIWNSISPGDLFPSNQRIFYKVTLSPTGDYTSYIFSVERQDSVGVSPSNQVRVLTSDSRETYSVLAKTINDNSKIILMNYADSGKESFILIDNDVFAINLTESGWYTFFKLLGASDQDIYNWADSLPYFADTYDVPISPLTITASAGDFSDSLSIGVIQDGMASFLGNNSFRPGGEVYSSELIEPEGAEAFKLISSAYYPPENVGLRMLPQGKLVSNQFVETETATGIQVVREPMEE